MVGESTAEQPPVAPPAEGRAAVRFDGQTYPAAGVARGAAYELFSQTPEPGFLPNPRSGTQWPYRRFVHVTEVSLVVAPEPAGPTEAPLLMPVSRALSWAELQRLSQVPPERYTAGEAHLVASVRRSVSIRRGTQMVKVLTGRQVAGHLAGWPLTGFCHREYDTAHLRTPSELAPFAGGPEVDDEVAFVLRWRAVDPLDYAVPLHGRLHTAAAGETDVSGLAAMPPQDRVGAQVLGTGFAPAGEQLVPEWTTADLADLPLPVGASIVGYTRDGTEVVLFTYLPEQSGWMRMCGPQWRGLLTRIPSSAPVGQEYFPVPAPASRLVGTYRGQDCDAIADPPRDFRVASKTRTVRCPVDSLARRTRYARWRDELGTVVRAHGDWRLLRLCTPDGESVRRLGASCVERGVYEAWAPATELTDDREVEFRYELPG